MTTETFGNYSEFSTGEEHLTLAFSPSTRPIKERWRNNGLTADFIADYFSTFLSKESAARKEKLKGGLRYIANELLENSMKFCNTLNDEPVTLRIDLHGGKLYFALRNRTVPGQGHLLRMFLKEFCAMDAGDFFVEQMERNLSDGTSSGLGFATMANDYNAQLGWQIATDEDDTAIVTTHVTIDF